jgi:hypothetical protein
MASQTVASFANGKYVVFDVQGNVTFRLTRTGGSNAVLSGVFLDAPTPLPPTSATLITTDAATQGNWKNAYGGQGGMVIGDSSNLPAYATPEPSGNSSFTWQASTTDVRALQQVNGTSRTAGTWYGDQFNVELGLSDGQLHRVALYFLDFDGGGSRAETVDVLDAGTGAVLATERVSDFANGKYLVFDIRGAVTFRLTRTGGSNAVLSGIFVGAGPAS